MKSNAIKLRISLLASVVAFAFVVQAVAPCTLTANANPSSTAAPYESTYEPDPSSYPLPVSPDPVKPKKSSDGTVSAAPQSAPKVRGNARTISNEENLKNMQGTALVEMGTMKGLSSKTMKLIYKTVAEGKNVVIHLKYEGKEHFLLVPAGTPGYVDCAWYGPLKLMSIFPEVTP